MSESYPERELGRPGLRIPRNGVEQPEGRLLRLAEMTNSLVLAAWVGISLLGIVLGLGFAKYSQSWGKDILHPGAGLGSAIVVVSAALGVLTTVRYWVWGADVSGLSRALGVLSIALVFALTWAALALIAFAGWELLPQCTR